MASGGADDELARTATDPGSNQTAPAKPAPVLGDVLGRYRLERTLGEGGMGVVHAAFDPDLERRVALKVLRAQSGGGEARQRLLREARAMARLTHPNVVTVHEVGSASGRDYVAMELVEGETLADWLRASHRSANEIVTAFVAAGRGLAAAHAAGLVHRDFKPHNVLRRRDGRICVTDFGLARGVEADARAAGADAKPAASSLSGITATGSVLGTPAYMAPEQWGGGAVGPEADQFAFGVALWEALTGERPFRGETIDDLKREVGRGPTTRDLHRLPRRLREPLRRGLEPDPHRRYPSMDAMLAALVRAERRPTVAIATAAVAMLGGALLWAAFGRGGGAPACDPPILAPSSVWSPTHASELRDMGQPTAAAAIQADFDRWGRARARACSAPPATRGPRLDCLDGVLARLDAVAHGAAVRGPPRLDVGELLIDPSLCEASRPPRLSRASSPELRDAIAQSLRWAVSDVPVDSKQAESLVTRAEGDPCAAALAHTLAADVRRLDGKRQHLEDADSAAQACGDDRITAEVAIAAARHALVNGFLGTDLIAKVKRAEALAAKLPQADLAAAIELLRMEVASRAGNVDDAIARADAAMGDFATRGRLRAELEAGLAAENLRQIRGHPDDLAAIPQQLAAWRARAASAFGEGDPLVRRIDGRIAMWTLDNGDVAAAHARLEALRRSLPNEHPQRITGRVIDADGQPVAGALVAAGPDLTGDAISVALAAPGDRSNHLRTTTTDLDGSFVLPDAPGDGIVIAQAGDRRSAPAAVADGTTLQLEPTSRLEGKVDLHGESSTNVVVEIEDQTWPASLSYAVIAPVQPDGTFWVDGAPRGKLHVRTEVTRSTKSFLVGTTVDVREPVVRGVQLSVAVSKRTIDVITRSTTGIPVPNAQVVVLPGRVASTTALELSRDLQSANIGLARQVEGEHAPPEVLALAKPGDLYATITEIPEGVASACAVSLPNELDDPDMERKAATHLDKIEVRCVPIAPDDRVVVVEVPPWPRLD
ncbi:MAG TPA: protein kinase [Kofleriaceae bacterium]|nr:protein kinase [Kofleriaceae bacterium]